ncbi:MAG: DNA polymerase III subunit delta [Chthonomonadales bacterium]
MEISLSRGNLKNLTKPLHRVVVLCGDDRRLVGEAVDTLKAAALDPEFQEFDFDLLDAEGAPAEVIFSSAVSAPVGAGRRVVLVRGADVLRRRDRERDAEKLALLMARIPQTTVLILTADLPADNTGKVILTRSLDAAVRREGLLARCNAPARGQMQQWLADQARLLGKELEPTAREMLANRTQGNTALLDQELRKLAAYVGDREVITAEDVASVSSEEGEDVIFSLVDAVGARNAHKSLALLAELLRYDPRPQAVAGRLLVLLVRQLRLIWQARELARMGYSPAAVNFLPQEIAASLPTDGAITSVKWKAPDLFRAARLWKRAELVQAFDLLAECDLANKGGEEGNADVALNLQVLLMKLCRRDGAGAHERAHPGRRS